MVPLNYFMSCKKWLIIHRARVRKTNWIILANYSSKQSTHKFVPIQGIFSFCFSDITPDILVYKSSEGVCLYTRPNILLSINTFLPHVHLSSHQIVYKKIFIIKFCKIYQYVLLFYNIYLCDLQLSLNKHFLKSCCFFF